MVWISTGLLRALFQLLRNFRSIRFSACMMLDLSAHRASRSGLWHGAFEGVATVTGLEVFDAEAMAARGRDLIAEAYSRGNCVIVGRGGQCVLQHMKDVLHVFIYAPWWDRIAVSRNGWRLPPTSTV